MKRSGFTMIELIFVIVILGILAAVAIPKLMATRTDAKISKVATNLQTAKNEIAAYVTSTGKFETEGAKMSNVIAEMVKSGTATDPGDSTTTFKTEDDNGTTEDCIKFDWSDGKDLNITHLSGSGAICKGVQAMVKEANLTIRGQAVKY